MSKEFTNFEEIKNDMSGTNSAVMNSELTEDALAETVGGSSILFIYGHHKGLDAASSGKCSKPSGILALLSKSYRDGYNNGQKAGGCR